MLAAGKDCVLVVEQTKDCVLHKEIALSDCVLHKQQAADCVLHKTVEADCVLHKADADCVLHKADADCVLHKADADCVLHKADADCVLHKADADCVLHKADADCVLHKADADCVLHKADADCVLHKADARVTDAKDSEVATYLDRLNAWDLSVVKAQVIRKNIFRADEVDALERDYKYFLALSCVADSGAVPVDRRVDEFWHAHILFTQDYAAMCKAVAGQFLHHRPSILDEARA